MRLTFVGALVACLTPAALGAQEIQPAVSAGAHSINFTFGGLGAFGLGGAGVDGGIGVSRFMAKDRALRLGLQLGYNHSTIPWSDNTTDQSDPGSDGSQSNMRLGLGVEYLRYIHAMTPRMRPYFGVGVTGLLSRSDLKPAVSDRAGAGIIIEKKNLSNGDGLTVGAGGVFGAEFFLYPELSVSAEYRLNCISYTHRADMVTRRRDVASMTERRGSAVALFGFGAGGATLHLYF